MHLGNADHFTYVSMLMNGSPKGIANLFVFSA